ncbi:uncharacterized protein LOC132948539 isoform X2 [Metopolophium dirhodum]|uniref:uncharacterized protein LOC132948539 isoform X2 n=1 Tax=Metopolophium dirhodum TaxID=44670 RepID=UPI0029902848|nr:uncharacterized protein LOC132948539 isoform X2 [Metopolophium dirhodum]
MVKNVSPYRRNKHFVLSPNNLARAEKNKKRNLSESPRKVYPSPETFQSSLSQELSPTTVLKYSPLKTYAQASAVSKQLFRPDNLSQPLTTLLENKQKTPPKPNKLKNSSYQFKKLILHNLLVLKHSIRNINKKLTLVVKRQISHNYNVEESNDLTLEYSNLDCLLPIDEEDTLDNIEEQLATDKKYHASLTKQLAGLGGKSIKVMFKRIIGYLFTDNILALYSFNGRANKKKCFANLSISKVIFSILAGPYLVDVMNCELLLVNGWFYRMTHRV